MRPDIAIFSPIGRSGTRAHGGITPFVACLSSAFCDMGLHVELVAFAGAEIRQLVPSLDSRVGVQDMNRGSRRRHAALLESYLRDRRPLALLSAGHRPNFVAISAARRQRAETGRQLTRIAVSVHNAISPGLRQLGPLRRILRLRELRRAYPMADAVVCVSAGVAADLTAHVSISHERLRVLHNPIPIADAEVSAGDGVPQAEAVHPWLAPGEPPVILGAGRLTRQKAFGTLIRAFALITDLSGYRLMIIGDGAERNALQRLAVELGVGQKVALPGFVSNPRAHMSRAALFVLSSDWEGFGNVLVEAMSTGTPVISTDCPSGPREILLDGALGPLVTPGDAHALAAAMRAELEARSTSPEALRARAMDFAPQRVAARYLDVLFPGGGG